MLKLAVIRFDALFLDVNEFLESVLDDLENSPSNYKKIKPSMMKQLRSKYRILENTNVFDTFDLSDELRKKIWDETSEIIATHSKQVIKSGLSAEKEKIIENLTELGADIIVICNSSLTYNLAKVMCPELSIKRFSSNKVLETEEFQELISGHNSSPSESLYISSDTIELFSAAEAGMFTVGVISPKSQKFKNANMVFNSIDEMTFEEIRFQLCSFTSEEEE